MGNTIITKEMTGETVLGQGVTIAKTWSTKPDKDGEASTVNGVIDFSGCSIEAILRWAAADRVISRQRVERTMKDVPKKVTIPAGQAGKKAPKTLEEQVSEMSDDAFEAFMKAAEARRQAKEQE